MARRELRASWKRLSFFFISLAVGVAAIVALRSVIQSVRKALASESRALTAADVLISANRPLKDDTSRALRERFSRESSLEWIEAVETTTMARSSAEGEGSATLVELRAIDAGFPYYGKIALEGERPYAHALLAGGGALARSELLARLGIGVGDPIWLGERRFTIRGVLRDEPGRDFSLFRLGPRVLIDRRDLETTGLLRFGSRASHQILVKLADRAVDPLVKDLRDLDLLKDEFVRVRSYREAEDRIGRRLAHTENYLSLAGFVIVMLGGVGVWSVIRVFIHQRLKTIAIWKCLGATTRQVLGAHLLQVMVLGLGGSLLGVVLAAVLVRSLPSGLVPGTEAVTYRLTGSAAAQGLAVGILISLLFSLVPLLSVRRIKPFLLLRPEHDGAFGLRLRLDRWTALTLALVASALVAVAAWQAGSAAVGILTAAGFVAVALALHLAGRALTRLLLPLGRKARFPLRHALIGLDRPGNQTRVLLLAVGLGSFFVFSIFTVEKNLLEEFALELGEDAPDLFVLDVQADQVESLREIARSHGARSVNLVPVLRARVTGVDGRQVRLEGYEEVSRLGSLGREYTITYRDRLEANERIVDGRFWDETASSEPEVSIELSLRDRFRIGIGDRVRFDVMGRTLDAKVTSVRAVEWSESRNGGFMFLFRPGIFESAPHSYVGFIQAPKAPDARARFQRELVSALPNLSIVDLRDVLKALGEVVRKVSIAVSLVGAMALVSGGIILVGSVAMTRFQRSYETAILRTLGASRRDMTVMMLCEYGTLGILAGAVGAAGAAALGWAVCREVFEIPYHAAIVDNLVGVGLAAMSVSGVGLATTLSVLKHKPLSILRAE